MPEPPSSGIRFELFNYASSKSHFGGSKVRFGAGIITEFIPYARGGGLWHKTWNFINLGRGLAFLVCEQWLPEVRFGAGVIK